MKKIILPLAIALLPAVMTAGSRTETFGGSLNAITASCGLDVTYNPGHSSTTVTVNGPDKVISYVEVKKNGSTLNIRLKDNRPKHLSLKGVTVTVNAPVVSSLSASSAADIDVIGNYKVNGTMKVAASSSGDVNISTLSASALDINASSSGDVEIITVNASSANLSASSSGDIEIKVMTCTELNTVASSSGDIEIESLSGKRTVASASSGGDVEIKNMSGESVNASASSGASIKLTGKVIRGQFSASSGATINKTGLQVNDNSVSTSSGGSVRP
ncbi:MAG: DUF2807 domain-containing protein [Duncaniella sp.]|nr:DUF2807 domain-containing protein [Duncaniella sp.]HBI58773.1 hypothetical protein [Porphyromonadaceae bacterium]